MINMYEKLGNYALDVSKYVLTGFVLTSLFSGLDTGSLQMYSVGGIIALSFMIVALCAYHQQNKKEEKKQQNKKGGKR